MLFSSDASERHDGSELGNLVLFGDDFFSPLVDRLFFERGAGGETEGPVTAGEVGPGGGDCGWVLFQVVGFEGEALVAYVLAGVFTIDRRGGFGASVGDAVESGLDAAATDGKVEGSIISDGEVGEGEGLSGDEFLDVGGVGSAIGLEVNGIEFSVGPVGDEEGFLIFGGELGPRSEDNSGRGSGPMSVTAPKLSL